MDSKSQIRELTTSELETLSAGMVTLDFGIVAIYLQFASVDTGPMTGATICGNNGDCVSRDFWPLSLRTRRLACATRPLAFA